MPRIQRVIMKMDLSPQDKTLQVTRKVQQQCNDQAGDYIETSVSMEIVKSTLNNIKYHHLNKRMNFHTNE